MTAAVAHEIKNPLNFVNNFAALSSELTGELRDVLEPVAMPGKIREEVKELTGTLKDNLERVVQKAVTRNLGDRLEVRIRDNGTGIPPDVPEKIFNPFFTTKARRGRYRARVEVVTEPGSFTEFIVTLPPVMP